MDYTTIFNKSFRTELYMNFFNVTGDYEWLRWILSFFIGAFIGFLAWSSKNLIKAVTAKKFELIQEQMNKESAEYYLLGYFMYVLFNISVAVLGSLIVVYYEPTAAGSGIPEVKAYLNGTKVLKYKILLNKIYILLYKSKNKYFLLYKIFFKYKKAKK